jgi:hypothetical protein
MQMRLSIQCVVAVVVTMYGSLYADEPDQIQRAAKFFQQHVVGRQFARPASVNYYDGDTVKSEAETTISFDALEASDEKMRFDHRSIYKQTITKVDQNKQAIGQPEAKDREFTNRIFLSRRKSTGELVGFSYSRNKDGTPRGEGYEMWTRIVSIGDDHLEMKQGIILYDDLYSGKESTDWRPGAYELTYRFNVGGDGKVVVNVTDSGFDVDPKTLARTPSSTPERYVFTEL